MPQVQRYGGQKVAPAALPGVRKQAAETLLSSGAGVARAQQEKAGAIGDLGTTAARVGLQQYAAIQDNARQEADETAVMQYQNALASFENKRLYDPNTGALTVKGQAAMTLPETVGDEFDKVAGDASANLSTDRQRQAAARITAERRINLDAVLRRHVFGEMQTWRGQELQSLVENAHSTAVANAQDPRRVGVEMQRGVDAITRSAPQLGIGPEQLEKQITAFRSSTHVGVIDQLLAKDQTKAAKIYYEESKHQIDGDAIARVEKAIQAGTQKGEAQKQADAILAAGGTLTEQRQKAKAIEDPDVRDLVTARLEHEDAVKDKEQRDADEALLTTAYDTIYKTHSMSSLSPATLAKLGSRLPGLQSFAIAMAKGIPVETDLPTYYALMQQAATDPATFVEQNLLEYRHKLDDTEFKQITGLQLSIRTGARSKADADLAGFRTHKQLVDDSLTQYGIDPNAKPETPAGKSIAQLQRMLDVRVDSLESLTGKKPTNTDIQKVLDDLLSQSSTTPGSFWNLWQDRTKRLIDVTAADVPAVDRQQITDALKRNGRPVSDATILDLYLESKARGK